MAVMRTTFAALGAVLLCLGGSAEAKPATRAPAEIHPALFVARDADSTLYIYGTMHVRPRGASWGGPEARAALAEADEVWTEIEITAAGDLRLQALVVQLGMAPTGRPLSSWLTEEENARLNRVAQRSGVARPMLEVMRPWLASITLSMAPILNAGYDPNSGADRSIDASARAAGKHIRAFETAEQQIHFIADLSDQAQHQMLLDSLDETEGGTEELDALVQAWERGDVRAIERLVVTDTQDNYPELYDVIFKRRNAAWVETLTHEMEGSGVDFVAVGAGHLVGPDGLVTQLRARGFRVDRVRARSR